MRAFCQAMPLPVLSCSTVAVIFDLSVLCSFLFILLLQLFHKERFCGNSQARSQGGFGGCGRTPLFLGPKKKIADGVRVNVRLAAVRFPGAIAPACTAVGLSKHDPEPNLESVAV